MFKSFTLAALVASASAYQSYSWDDGLKAGVYRGDEAFVHDQAWGHDHYEPGNVKRFDGHFAEIYGADDLAWGPNGYQNPQTTKDSVHNWDDQGDAYTCHSCGGHGCGLCGGYGHFHRNSQFGYHGHSLRSGFGVGHSHAYLGPKNRSSYSKYGHGIGGRYSQRWSNGAGDRYGLTGGHRYGLAHRWSVYNGYGKGNPSSKGSNMGYGIGANAETPVILDDRMGGYDDYGMDYADDYSYGYDDYGYDDEYADYGYDDYGDYDYYYPEEEMVEEEPMEEGEEVLELHMEDAEYPSYEVVEEEPEMHHYEEPEYYYEEPEYHPYMPVHQGRQYYTDYASGYGDIAPGYGDAYYGGLNDLGRSSTYQMAWSNGHGNHSPFHGETGRNDRGMMNYMGRPAERHMYHNYFDFPV